MWRWTRPALRARVVECVFEEAKGAGWKAVMGDTLAPHPDEVLASDLATVVTDAMRALGSAAPSPVAP